MALNTVLTHNDAAGEIGGASGNGDFDTPSDVPEGVLAFFPATSAGNSINLNDTNNAKFEDQGRIIAVLGTEEGEAPRRTNPFVAGETEVSSLSYQAPSLQKTIVAPETVSEETVVGIKISSVEQNTYPYDRQSITFQADSSMTKNDISSKLRDRINELEDGVNGEGDVDVTASVNGSDNLVLEADNAGDIFHVAILGDLEATVTRDTDPTPGSGTGEQVVEMEENVFGILGRTQVDDGILGRQPDPKVFADPDGDYNLITLRVETNYDEAINPANKFQDIKLAFETPNDFTHLNSFFENQGVSF